MSLVNSSFHLVYGSSNGRGSFLSGGGLATLIFALGTTFQANEAPMFPVYWKKTLGNDRVLLSCTFYGITLGTKIFTAVCLPSLLET